MIRAGNVALGHIALHWLLVPKVMAGRFYEQYWNRLVVLFLANQISQRRLRLLQKRTSRKNPGVLDVGLRPSDPQRDLGGRRGRGLIHLGRGWDRASSAARFGRPEQGEDEGGFDSVAGLGSCSDDRGKNRRVAAGLTWLARTVRILTNRVACPEGFGNCARALNSALMVEVMASQLGNGATIQTLRTAPGTLS